MRKAETRGQEVSNDESCRWVMLEWVEHRRLQKQTFDGEEVCHQGRILGQRLHLSSGRYR